MGKVLTFFIGFIICAVMAVFWPGFNALLSDIGPGSVEEEPQSSPVESKIEKIKDL